MSKTIDPYDLGKINLVSQYQKLDINDIVKKTTAGLKKEFLKSRISALGLKIDLTTSTTRFHGKRIWFECPICKRRTGVIFADTIRTQLGCRKCLGLKYKKQRFKGMIEQY